MEPTRERLHRRQPGVRHNRTKHNIYAPCGMFKPSRLQRPSLKWRKDRVCRGKRILHYNKRNDEVKKTPEEAEEEERKKKLIDTANKLLSKIKTWNSENANAEPEKSEVPQKVDEPSRNDGVDSRPKRIAHSKTVSSNKAVRRVVSKRKASNPYDVNKETLRNFQSRIQHKLIEDIMQMPRENLQNMLNDPKINPIMEAKMTSLVRENKPLIAKKLRALAEDKIKSSGRSQILLDFDKLIDPVIETDLSVLPYELIKEMENVFQVQFDYSPEEMRQVKNEVVNNESDVNVQEDVNAYDCSTDEDEEEVVILEDQALFSECNSLEEKPPLSSPNVTNIKGISDINMEDSRPSLVSSQCQTDFCLRESTASQTYSVTDSVSTQTDPGFLYGVPLPVEAKDGSSASLMEEVDSIQNLINKLNEKRFSIFLQLARMNPNENFNYLNNRNFIETVSNGSISLIESLTSVFRIRNYGETHSRSKVRYNRQRNFARHDRRK